MSNVKPIGDRLRDIVVPPPVRYPAPIPQIIEVQDILDDIHGLYDRGIERGKRTGWSSLDEWYTVRKGEWTLITGYPNHGKSCWLDNLLVNLATRENWKFGVFSAENLPVTRHIASLAEIYLGKPFSRGPSQRMTRGEMEAALEWINAHFLFYNTTLPERNLDYILEIGQMLTAVHECDGLVLDPWNELDHARPKEMREDEYISVSLSRIRDFTRATKIHFFVVAHPRIARRDPGSKNYPVPTLFDVKGASEWNAKADNGIAVWRDMLEPENGTDVHVQKVRFREVGKAGGGARLQYDSISGRFTDPNHRPTIDDYMARREREPGEEG